MHVFIQIICFVCLILLEKNTFWVLIKNVYSNEYPQCMFLWRNKKNYHLDNFSAYLELRWLLFFSGRPEDIFIKTLIKKSHKQRMTTKAKFRQKYDLVSTLQLLYNTIVLIQSITMLA